MRVWFVKAGEPLPIEPDERLLRYGRFTRYLAGRGHEVTWWTSTFSHKKKTHVVTGHQMRVSEGVRLALIHGPRYRRNVSLGRILHDAHFARTLGRFIRKEPRPDLIVAGFPTVDAAYTLYRHAKRHGIPLVVDVRDEWPEVIIRVVPPMLRPVLRLALHRQFRKAHRVLSGARALLGVTRLQLDYGLRVAGRPEGADDRVFHLGGGLDAYDGSQMAEARTWLADVGVRPDAFVVAFVGTFTPVRPLGDVLRAARRMADLPDVQFVLCGTGEDLPRHRTEARDLPSVLFPGWVDGPRMRALLEAAAVALAPYRPGMNFSLPIKMFDYMAAGLPIVTNCDGEIRDLIQEHGIGRSYDGEQGRSLEAALRELHGDPQEARRMGERSAGLFRDRFSDAQLFPQMESHLEALANGPLRGGSARPTRGGGGLDGRRAALDRATSEE